VPRVLLPEEGRAVLVYFDDIHVQAENSVLVRSTLAPFLARELRPGDAITISLGAGLWWTARTAWEQAQLPSVVERLVGTIPDPFGDYTTDWLVMQHIEYGNVMVTSSTGVDPARAGQVPSTGSYLKDAEEPRALTVKEQERYGLALLRIQRSLNGLQRAIESLAGFRGRKSVVIYSEASSSRRSCRTTLVSSTLPARQRRAVRGRPARHAGRLCPLRVPEAALGTEMILPGTVFEAENAGSAFIALATSWRGVQKQRHQRALARARGSTAYYLIGFQPAEGRAGERKLRCARRGRTFACAPATVTSRGACRTSSTTRRPCALPASCRTAPRCRSAWRPRRGR
jgi:hypothetical protein